ncbi:MAG: endonuclease domain-containing protein [Beijerinckiaceae bacterium]
MPDTKDRADPRTGRARALRRNATLEERRVWFRLRQLDVGGHFRRQVPVGPYFADFAHHGLKLIIEIDGGQHGTPSRALQDEKRDQWFAANGYRTLRFWNHEVRENIDGVIDTVLATIGHVETEIVPPPQPSPPQAGGGSESANPLDSMKKPKGESQQ